MSVKRYTEFECGLHENRKGRHRFDLRKIQKGNQLVHSSPQQGAIYVTKMKTKQNNSH